MAKFLMNALNRFADLAFCITRLIVGLMFDCHGRQKILGFPPGGHGMPTETLGIIGAWIELVGGSMIALGFLTRIAAFIASGEMAVGYFMRMHPVVSSRFKILASQRCSIAGSSSSLCFMARGAGVSTHCFPRVDQLRHRPPLRLGRTISRPMKTHSFCILSRQHLTIPQSSPRSHVQFTDVSHG